MRQPVACEPLIDLVERARQRLRQGVGLRDDLLAEQPADPGEDSHEEENRQQNRCPVGKSKMLRKRLGDRADYGADHDRSEQQDENRPAAATGEAQARRGQ